MKYAILFIFFLIALSGCSTGDLPATATAILPTATSIPVSAATSIPTRASVPQSTPIPANTPVPVPPSETPIPVLPTATADVYTFLAHVNYQDSAGSDVVAGVIKYTGEETIAVPEVAVTLKDASGGVLATQKVFVMPDLIKPGGLIPYKAQFTNPPKGWENFETVIRSDETNVSSVDAYYGDLAVTQSRLTSGGQFSAGPQVVGSVTNTGTSEANLVQVIGALWNDKNELLDVSSGFTTISDLSPGDDSAFEIDFSNGEGATKYDLVVSAFKK